MQAFSQMLLPEKLGSNAASLPNTMCFAQLLNSCVLKIIILKSLSNNI